MQGWGGGGGHGKEASTPNPNRNREETPKVEVLALLAELHNLGGLAAQRSLRLHEATTEAASRGQHS